MSDSSTWKPSNRSKIQVEVTIQTNYNCWRISSADAGAQSDQLFTEIKRKSCKLLVKFGIGDYNGERQYVMDAQVNTKKCSLLFPAEIHLKVSDLLQRPPEWHTTRVKPLIYCTKELWHVYLYILFQSLPSLLLDYCTALDMTCLEVIGSGNHVFCIFSFVLNLPQMQHLRIHRQITQPNKINWWVSL